MVYSDIILYDIEGDLGCILPNHVASTIPKGRTFKLVSWMQLLNRLVDLDDILYGGDNMEGHLDVIFLFRSFNNSKMADVKIL
jgi:hypothetical protein